MKIRAAIVTGLVLATCVSVVAEAATAKVCKIVKDGTGDAEGIVPGPDDALDIVSGDVATNTKTVTGVIRLKKYAETDTNAPMGRVYYMHWVAPGTPDILYVSASVDPVTGVTYDYGYLGSLGIGTYEKLGDATGKIDVAKNEIRIHAPISGFKGHGAKMAPKASLKSLRATSTYLIGVLGSGLVSDADEATDKTYVMSTPSCVTVGK